MTYTIEQLTQAGGTRWTKNGMDRFYFNNISELFGLSVSTYKTGNISSATLNGEPISNSKATAMKAHFDHAKLWFDTADNLFHGRDFADGELKSAVAVIKSKMGV